MGERSPDQPPADPPRSDLTPVQQAYGAYVRHAVGCDDCRSADAGPCAAAEVLWEAYRQLRRGSQAAARF